MPWFELRARCAAHPELDVDRLRLDLYDEGVEPLSVTAAPGGEISVTLAFEGADAPEVRAGAAAMLDALGLAVKALGDPTPTSDPRRLSEPAVALVKEVADLVADLLNEDAEALREGCAFEDTMAARFHLPPGYARHYTPALVARLALTVRQVGRKLVEYPDTYLACTAEELAGHAIIFEAYAILDDGGSEAGAADPLRDKLDEVHDLAFEDHDVLMLFDASLDGLQDDERVVNQMGFANLSPPDWFTPFRA